MLAHSKSSNVENAPRRVTARLAHRAGVSLGALLCLTMPAPAQDAPGLHPRVQVQTTLGEFVLELNAQLAPVTVVNFVDYVQHSFYNDTIFHRVASPTVVQGGAYTADMVEKIDGLHDPIPSESYNGLKNERWTIAMYRVPGEPHSARAQFFINTNDNAVLDRLRDGDGYTVFGKVVEGIAVIEKIRDTPVSTHPKYAAGKNPVVPVTPVVIQSMTLAGPWDQPAAIALAKNAELTPDRKLNTLLKRTEIQTGKTFTITPSGLRILELREGHGAFPLIGEAVEINYTGTLLDGREFDSSLRQAEGPATINVRTAIAGLRETFTTMREGGKRLVVVSPELGYGANGVPGRVPSNATLVYEVELLSVKPPVKRPTAEDIQKAKP